MNVIETDIQGLLIAIWEMGEEGEDEVRGGVGDDGEEREGDSSL